MTSLMKTQAYESAGDRRASRRRGSRSRRYFAGHVRHGDDVQIAFLTDGVSARGADPAAAQRRTAALERGGSPRRPRTPLSRRSRQPARYIGAARCDQGCRIDRRRCWTANDLYASCRGPERRSRDLSSRRDDRLPSAAGLDRAAHTRDGSAVQHGMVGTILRDVRPDLLRRYFSDARAKHRASRPTPRRCGRFRIRVRMRPLPRSSNGAARPSGSPAPRHSWCCVTSKCERANKRHVA